MMSEHVLCEKCQDGVCQCSGKNDMTNCNCGECSCVQCKEAPDAALENDGMSL